MNFKQSKRLCSYLEKKLGLENVEAIIINHRPNKNRVVVESFGIKENLERYYDLFQPLQGINHKTIISLAEPLIEDFATTIQFFMEESKIETKWIFGFTDNAIRELESIAVERRQIQYKI